MEEMRRAALAYYENSPNEFRQKAKALFRKMDVNGDKRISIQEYSNYLRSVGCGRLSDQRMFRELDKDGNGSLDFYEFITLSYMVLCGRVVYCDGCGVFLKGLYFTCVQCFETSSFNLCCDCFQHKKYSHHVDAVFLDNYVLLRGRGNDSSSGTSSSSSSQNKTKKFLRELDEAVESFVTGFDIGTAASNVCNSM